MVVNSFDVSELLEDITDLVQSVAPDGKFLYVNRAWRETLGYSQTEFAHLHFSDIVHPDSLEHCQEMFARILNGENHGSIEAKFVTKSGEVVFVDGASRCSFRDGKPLATRSIFRNVTEKRLTEEKLRDRETLFHTFMNNSPVIFFMKDAQGKYVYANQTMEEMFPVQVSELIGLDDFEWLPETVARSVSEKDHQVLETQQNNESVEATPRDDGSTDYWSVFKFPFNDADGNKYVGGAAIKITAQKEFESELRRRQREIETLVENSRDVIARFDENIRFVFVNAAIEKLFGVEKSFFIGKNFADAEMNDAAFLDAEREMRAAFAEKRGATFEMRFPFPTGWRYFQVQATPEFSADGERVETLMLVARDTTERKEMEETVRRSERHYRNLVEGGQGFLFTHDRGGKILTINPAAAHSLGYSITEITGKNLRDFMREERFQELSAYLKRVWKEKSADGVLSILNKAGDERFWKFQNVKLVETVEEPFILGYAQDITDLKETEKQLKNLSLSDDLTGLYNRRGFLALGEKYLQNLRRLTEPKNNYLIYADMDGLKQINDSFGHEEGSRAIMKISEILAGNFRGSDVISRIGGDEFVVLMTNADEQSTEIVINRLQSKIESYNAQKIHPFQLALSVGITAIKPDETKALEEILAEADKQMYEQKKLRKLNR